MVARAAPPARMVALHHDRFDYPLPPGHRFPLSRYRMLREELRGDAALDVREARAATDLELSRVHTADYLRRARTGGLSARERAALGLPWSARLVERARRSVGATVDAAHAARAHGTGVNLGGGTHHAAPSAGRGFCMFNDVVCAIRALRADGALGRVVVIDMDVHQGDGTHLCCAGDPDTVTASVNGGRNYPFRRVPADVEVDLADGTGDEEYVAAARAVAERALEMARAEMCFYVAGADPWEGDRLGRLAVTHEGLEARDRMVRDLLRAEGIPVCVVLGGGYGEPIAGTVAINAATVRLFAQA